MEAAANPSGARLFQSGSMTAYGPMWQMDVRLSTPLALRIDRRLAAANDHTIRSYLSLIGSLSDEAMTLLCDGFNECLERLVATGLLTALPGMSISIGRNGLPYVPRMLRTIEDIKNGPNRLAVQQEMLHENFIRY